MELKELIEALRDSKKTIKRSMLVEAADTIEALLKDLKEGTDDLCEYCIHSTYTSPCDYEPGLYSCCDCEKNCPCSECYHGDSFVWRGKDGGVNSNEVDQCR